MSEVWRPNVTVASIVEREGQFLMVREETPDGVRLNQPAGHLEPGESLVQAVIRETLEETAHQVSAQAVVGIFMSRYQQAGRAPGQPVPQGRADPQADASGAVDVSFLRFAFACRVEGFEDCRALDSGIIEAVWLSAEEIAACQSLHRSALVQKSLDAFLAGRRYPLDLIYTDPAAFLTGIVTEKTAS